MDVTKCSQIGYKFHTIENTNMVLNIPIQVIFLQHVIQISDIGCKYSRICYIGN